MPYLDDYVTLASIQRQLDDQKGLLVHLERQDRGQRRYGVDLAQTIIRSIVAKFKAHRVLAHMGPETAESIAKAIYGRRSDYHNVELALADLPALIQRAAILPAQTTVATWASELIGTAIGVVPALAPSAAYTKLAARGLRLSFNQNGAINIPTRLTSPTVAGDFVGEGLPIPVRKIGLNPISVGPPKKLGVISYFSDELKDRSVPSIEAVLRTAIAEDTATTLDTRMLDATAGSIIRPAGLLNGLVSLTPTTGTGVAALAGDLGNLAAAIPNASDLVYLMTAAERARALTLSPGLLGLNIIEASTLPAKRVVALDASDFVSGEDDQARFDLSNQAVIHADDTTPLAIGTVGTPNVVAAPTRSMFQENLTALRMVMFVTFAMRRSGRISFVDAVTW